MWVDYFTADLSAAVVSKWVTCFMKNFFLSFKVFQYPFIVVLSLFDSAGNYLDYAPELRIFFVAGDGKNAVEWCLCG